MIILNVPDEPAQALAGCIEVGLEGCDVEEAKRIQIASLAASLQVPAPPAHLFEVRITIAGDYWDYVERTLQDLAMHIKAHGPDCSMMSGVGGGSHSVTILRRDVSAEQFRKELDDWHIANFRQPPSGENQR